MTDHGFLPRPAPANRHRPGTSAEPAVLLCDEPTSALDVSVQAQILNLLMDLQDKRGFACVVVTHDLAVARVLADDVVVLRHGAVRFHGPLRWIAHPGSAAGPFVAGLVDASRQIELPASSNLPVGVGVMHARADTEQVVVHRDVRIPMEKMESHSRRTCTYRYRMIRAQCC